MTIKVNEFVLIPQNETARLALSVPAKKGLRLTRELLLAHIRREVSDRIGDPLRPVRVKIDDCEYLIETVEREIAGGD